MKRTLPKPEPALPPFYLDSQLWSAMTMFFVMFFGVFFGLFIVVDNGHLNNCDDPKYTGGWKQLCINANNEIIRLLSVLGSLSVTGITMYCISKKYSNGIDSI